MKILNIILGTSCILMALFIIGWGTYLSFNDDEMLIIGACLCAYVIVAFMCILMGASHFADNKKIDEDTGKKKVSDSISFVEVTRTYIDETKFFVNPSEILKMKQIESKIYVSIKGEPETINGIIVHYTITGEDYERLINL